MPLRFWYRKGGDLNGGVTLNTLRWSNYLAIFMLICNNKIFFLGDNTADTMIYVTGDRLSSRCCQLLVTALNRCYQTYPYFR